MYFFAYFVIASASSIIVPVSFDGDHYVRIPVVFNALTSGDDIAGYIGLQFSLLPPPFIRRPRDSHIAVRGYIATNCENFRDTFDEEFGELLGLNTYTLSVSADPISDFARSNFVIYPTSVHDGVLNINPANPAEYALDNELYFSTPSSDRYAWTVNRMALRLLSPHEDSFAPMESASNFVACRIDETKNILTIPNDIMVRILRQASALGIRTNINVSGSVTFEEVYEEALDRLPSIQYIFHTDDGRYVSIATIQPREYISEDTGRLMLKSHSSHPNDCTLTPSNLKKLVVFFDSRNNRIGFGEPLIEL